MGGFFPPGDTHPKKVPLVPKTARSFHFPKTPDEFDLGFPPPSHAYLNQQVPPRNEELTFSQAGLTDFGEVLRKKHAAVGLSVSESNGEPAGPINIPT